MLYPTHSQCLSLIKYLSLLLLILMACITVQATEIAPDDNGQVQLPLSVYNHLINLSTQDPRPAPAGYAIGNADIKVTVADRDDRSTAQVEATVMVEVFEDEWTLIPVLASGTALNSVTVDGEAVQLVQGPDGLSWSTDRAGTVTMRLKYGLDAQRSTAGFVLPVPIPRAAATQMQVSFPGTGLDLAVVPAADINTIEQGELTLTTASIPSTGAVMISWRAPSNRPYVISRAHYQGTLEGQALVWNASYAVEIFEGERITLPVMPSSITLSDLQVDGQPATVLEQDSHFATVIHGRGVHTVTAQFHIPVITDAGPPSAHFLIPRVPVSQFDLALPGRKELSVFPHANVNSQELDDLTQTTVYVPMSDQVTFSWVEAVPEHLRTEVRANASIYHALHAEEGVLHGRALVAYEITHGETNQLALLIPAHAQINSITANNANVSDWAVESNQQQSSQDIHDSDQTSRDTHNNPAPAKRISIFLDRAVRGELVLEVAYEYLTGVAGDEIKIMDVPLLAAAEVHRQRGMIALLVGPELILTPVDEKGVSRVGENQLPAFVRNSLKMAVAHTYKYTDPQSLLSVRPTVPERQQGKFDAQVDTLISIGEVTLTGSASIAVNVKSGSIMDLVLQLPEDINVFGVTGPSIRNHDSLISDGMQKIQLEFTQEMQGQFKLEINYERITDDGATETEVPTILVADAEVEHGRIAIEALTAVEVQAGVAEQLSSLEINELPRQLVLKTTNPILLAYKYVQPPFKLALNVTHHEEIDVQVATIEKAEYETLFTRDGLAVTTANFIVRNSRRQFLRLNLPQEANIWSVFVDGRAEKPAHSDATNGEQHGKQVLIKMINSADGFPVKIIYAMPADPFGSLGKISSRLVRPDMVVTHTYWDVFLPTGINYQRPHSNMQIVSNGTSVNPAELRRERFGSEDFNVNLDNQPLQITVPTQGIHFAFEKLYANQAAEDPQFTIRYASMGAGRIGGTLSALAVILIWLGIVALGSNQLRLSKYAAIAMLGLGMVMLITAIGPIGSNLLLPSTLALFIAFTIAVWLAINYWKKRQMML